MGGIKFSSMDPFQVGHDFAWVRKTNRGNAAPIGGVKEDDMFNRFPSPIDPCTVNVFGSDQGHLATRIIEINQAHGGISCDRGGDYAQESPATVKDRA